MYTNSPIIVVLSGGTGPEREISLISGKALTKALSESYEVRHIELTENLLPSNINPAEEVIFPVIHGEFGEDGDLQRLMDDAGFKYAGSGEYSSRLCMNKDLAKSEVMKVGVTTPKGVCFDSPNDYKIEDLIQGLGNDLILKPLAQGSSVSLETIRGGEELKQKLNSISDGQWLLEERINGREVTVGILQDEILGIVEVIPDGGVYDYQRKYTPGATRYIYPAVLPKETELKIKEFGKLAFKACKCSDFARVDFMLKEDGNPFFLEINTLPGLTPTSLLPKSASINGYNFTQLTNRLIEPALNRFLSDQPITPILYKS